MLSPLFFEDDQLGFVLFEMGPREGTIYEALREQPQRAALKGAILVREVVEKDREGGSSSSTRWRSARAGHPKQSTLQVQDIALGASSSRP